jgi:hypothetical protein
MLWTRFRESDFPFRRVSEWISMPKKHTAARTRGSTNYKVGKGEGRECETSQWIHRGGHTDHGVREEETIYKENIHCICRLMGLSRK